MSNAKEISAESEKLLKLATDLKVRPTKIRCRSDAFAGSMRSKKVVKDMKDKLRLRSN